MSKKSKRARQARLPKQLQHRPPVSSQIHPHWLNRAKLVKEQMFRGEFAEAIKTCEPLLVALPKRSEIYMEVLASLGLAHGMLQHYQQSYDIFSEGIALDPTRAELWYNHGLASYFLGRIAQAVENFERAVALSEHKPHEMADKFVKELESTRAELAEAMEAHEPDLTLEQYREREERFAQGMGLVKQDQWEEAEHIFRQLTQTGAQVPAYWGNLGVCLIMLGRYDEAEEVLKQALAIDPDYPIARDNLQTLPEVRRTKKPIGLELRNAMREEDSQQSLTLYEKDEEGTITNRTTLEQPSNATPRTRRPLGKQPPRYDLFLNHHRERFTTCPRCQIKTRPRKFCLVVNVKPTYTMIFNKICRFCYVCSLLIIHKDQL